MIIQQQNFNENFNAAVKYEDISLLFTIFSGELADLFLQREEEIFELFDQCGIKYNKVSVYEVYVDKILKGIKNGNEELVVGLSFLFCDNNNEIDGDWEANLDSITTGILTIGEYLNDNNYNFLKVTVLDSIRVRLRPNNKRNLKFEDSTAFTAVFLVGVALLIYFSLRKKPIKPIEVKAPPPPEISNPAFNVSPDVLIPESQMPPKVEAPIVPQPQAIPEIKQEVPKPNIEAVKIETPTETIQQTVTPKAT